MDRIFKFLSVYEIYHKLFYLKDESLVQAPLFSNFKNFILNLQITS